MGLSIRNGLIGAYIWIVMLIQLQPPWAIKLRLRAYLDNRKKRKDDVSRDSSRTYIHLASARYADLFEDFTRTPLLPEDIYVPPQHQPINPEDEDDVVPDQHAAFGIQRATQKQRPPAWRDLGLEELLASGPSEPAAVGPGLREGEARRRAAVAGVGSGVVGATGAASAAGSGNGSGSGSGSGSGLPR
ncbi:Apc13p protein-domain-containing protein [Phyllosticta citricarpa]|uniref:Apc13p protein-domain-containing protein n=1 Tax=Phyllosticta citricarpa TaxID=55181 RepID=A0ABR1LRM7_9PEZI